MRAQVLSCAELLLQTGGHTVIHSYQHDSVPVFYGIVPVREHADCLIVQGILFG
ncbi:hypothetical protein D3C76_1413700 [compost metagenome]